MKFNAVTLLTFAAAASASAFNKREAVPSAAEASFLAALPSSLQAVLATNTPAAISLIASEVATGAPWFTALPTDVQVYVITAGNDLAGSATRSGANTAPTGSFNGTTVTNSTTTRVSSTTSTKTSSTVRTSSATGASSSSSSGVAAMPTAVIGAGLAGAVGFLGMLAL